MKKLLVILSLLLLTGCYPREISVILNEGYDIIGVNEEWEDAGCILNVNEKTSLDMDVYSNNLDLTTPGEYEIIYSKEYDNTDYTCKRIIKVVDEEAPLVFLIEGIDTIVKGGIWNDAGITTLDNFDTDLDITVTGSVNINVVGSYEITYTVIDDAQNVTIITRIVNIID